MASRRDRDRNEVEIDLDKYMALLDQLDEQEDQIIQLKDDARKLKERNAFLEKLHNQHRYVFSEIPNTEENMKMVKLMKKHINKDRYTVRWRGQYLIDGEDWKKYTDGQPMNKSKCIRVYLDKKRESA